MGKILPEPTPLKKWTGTFALYFCEIYSNVVMANFSLSPIENPVEASKAKQPSPDIILRRDNDFMRAAATHQWDSNEEDEDEEEEQKVPDVQKDDLASRRARMNQFKPSVAHNFLPVSCSWKDREKWEGIRLASQHAVLERMEKLEQEKKRCACDQE